MNNKERFSLSDEDMMRGSVTGHDQVMLKGNKIKTTEIASKCMKKKTSSLFYSQVPQQPYNPILRSSITHSILFHVKMTKRLIG